MKNKKFIFIFLLIIFIIFSLVFILQLFLKFMNKSPADLQIIYVALGVVTSYLLVMSYNLGLFVGKSKEFMAASKNTFQKISHDLKRVDEGLQKLGEKIGKK